ncbi:unnamed protein product [Phytophthora lilii]|uniref:Unnamed protein product n=1 Tax=Phytophthora lilii TaxID=2077276 RepID=A0A9W6TK17_9STRA|nr:unnamed protein product [Phytophthora lilii]
MVAKSKRKAPAPADDTAKTKRVTRSSTAAAGSSTAEDVRPPAHANEEAPPSGKSCTGGNGKIVAFLRGVNVGGRVHSMKSIADALGKAGLCNVETFLASGNVIFDSPSDAAGDEASVLAIEQRVEDALEKLFGAHIPVFARSMSDVAQLGERIVKTSTAVNVVLVKEELTREQQDILDALATDADELKPLDKAFVWYSATKMSESPLFKIALDKKLGVPVTVRTVNTLRRIVKKFG